MAIKYANRVPAARAAAHRDAAARERVRRMGARKPARPPPGGRRDLHGRRFGHTARPDATHHLRHNRVLHERVLLVSTVSSDAPRVDPELRVKLAPVGAGITRVTLHFGFMEHPDVMEGLKLACRDPSLLGIDPERITFYSRRLLSQGHDRAERQGARDGGMAGASLRGDAPQRQSSSRLFRRADRTGRRGRPRGGDLSCGM
jgi:hypothetical protein